MSLDKKLNKILVKKGKDTCPHCGRKIDRGDLAWNNKGTEAGTPYSVVECICSQCENEVFTFHSWYPTIDDLDDLIYVINEDLEDKKD